MKISLFDNWVYKIAALIIAVILWTMVLTIEQPELQRSFDARLIYINIPPTLSVIDGPSTIRVEVNALGSKIIEIDPDEVMAFVDLRNAEAGTATYPVRLNYAERIRRVAKLTPRPEQVEVTLEHNIDKTLPVEAQFVGKKEGFQLDSYSLDPPKIRIFGPESLVLSAVKARVTIDLAKLEPGGAYEQPVEVLDRENRPIGRLTVDPPRVTFRGSLQGLVPMKTLIVSPVWKGSPKIGYRVVRYTVEPNQVRVSGNAALLAELSTVETEPIDINEIDSTKEFRVKLVLPPELKVQGSQYVTVVVEVEKQPNPSL
ncbi:MAG TPA: CdaR family protein [Fimbriimonadales bacterium]|nr:CdaR family protein [Fimbriimonadales bacterium]